MTNCLYLNSYMMFVKWSSFATPKIELLLSINLLLCTCSCVLAVVQIIREKPERTLYEQCVEHAWSDQNSVVKNYLNQCVEVQYVLNITSLGPALFSNDSSVENADNRNSHINLVIDNTNIIDRYKNFNILLFKEALKINERKPTLNTGLKASKELQLF